MPTDSFTDKRLPSFFFSYPLLSLLSAPMLLPHLSSKLHTCAHTHITTHVHNHTVINLENTPWIAG